MRRAEAKTYVDWTKQQLQASGLPASLEDLNHFYRSSVAGSSAGRSLLRLLQRHEDSMTGYDYHLERLVNTNFLRPFSPEHLDRSRDYVNRNSVLLVSLENLLKRSETARLPLDFTTPVSKWVDHLLLVVSAARLFCHRALLRIDKGKSIHAVDDLRRAIQLSEFMTYVPFLISQIFRYGCIVHVLKLVEQLINRCPLSVKHFDRMQDGLTSIATDGLVLYSLVGERCLFLAALKQGGWNRIYDESMRQLPTEYRRWQSKIEDRTYRSLELGYLLFLVDQLATLCTRLPHERNIPAFDLEADTLEGKTTGNVLCKTSGVEILRMVRVENHLIAAVDVAVTAIEILRSRRKSRYLPKQLTELKLCKLSNIPTDPFSGDPIKYRRTGKGFVVYSIGPDFRDGKGHPPRRGASIFESGDVVFRVLR